jgi:hypothetical protein
LCWIVCHALYVFRRLFTARCVHERISQFLRRQVRVPDNPPSAEVRQRRKRPQLDARARAHARTCPHRRTPSKAGPRAQCSAVHPTAGQSPHREGGCGPSSPLSQTAAPLRRSVEPSTSCCWGCGIPLVLIVVCCRSYALSTAERGAAAEQERGCAHDPRLFRGAVRLARRLATQPAVAQTASCMLCMFACVWPQQCHGMQVQDHLLPGPPDARGDRGGRLQVRV